MTDIQRYGFELQYDFCDPQCNPMVERESGEYILHINLAEKSERIAVLSAENKQLREALESYAICSDGCTCGDGWDHKIAQEALRDKGIGNE